MEIGEAVSKSDHAESSPGWTILSFLELRTNFEKAGNPAFVIGTTCNRAPFSGNETPAAQVDDRRAPALAVEHGSSRSGAISNYVLCTRSGTPGSDLDE
jgi:hypothetical protein